MAGSRGSSRRGKNAGLKPLPIGRRRDRDGLDRAQEPEPENVSTWPRRWVAAFRTFAKGEHMRNDKSGAALRGLVRRAGNPHINEELLSKNLKKAAGYTLLASADVFSVLQGYEADVCKAAEAAFLSKANYGMMHVRHLKDLLQDVGYVMLPDDQQEVLEEAAESLKIDVPSAKGGGITMALFMRVLDFLSEREGFSKSQYDRLMQTCIRYDIDGSGVFETTELPPVSTWLRFCTESGKAELLLQEAAEEAKRIAQEQVDCLPEDSPERSKEVKSHLDFIDFIRCMRRHFNSEYVRTSKIFQTYDGDRDGLLTVMELLQLFRSLGLALCPQALIDAVRANGLTDMFSFSDFWRILDFLRDREGFTNTKLDDAVESFRHFDIKRKGQITTRQAQHALKWNGYLLGLSVFSETDHWKEKYGKRGLICEAEFLRIIREHDEADLKIIRSVYRQYAEQKGVGLLAPEHLTTALKMVNARYAQYYDDWLKHNPIFDTQLDFEEFRQIAESFRLLVRGTFRASCGYMLKDVKPIKDDFQSRGPGADGMLAEEKVAHLLDHMYPALRVDFALREKMRASLRDHNATSCSIDFVSLLGILRTFQDKCEAEQDEMAKTVSEELQLSRWHVDDALDAFHICRCAGSANARTAVRQLSTLTVRKVFYGLDDATEMTLQQESALLICLRRLLSEQPMTSVEAFIKVVQKLRKIALEDLGNIKEDNKPSEPPSPVSARSSSSKRRGGAERALAADGST